eukprot:CAMPEP_0117697028 /NCGR_PEP_ID=MMETSP0804-20121206/29000_1 /TAXON_ID=1074897 /ORGANISM="Tetraselmis astigmatica, Strain CCMP880" /LENGTH=55 /DNA_ID=CAMNT_0005511231 /DNA_START=67 /DNA_END=231 /DNA_ORIENTATION=-
MEQVGATHKCPSGTSSNAEQCSMRFHQDSAKKLKLGFQDNSSRTRLCQVLARFSD